MSINNQIYGTLLNSVLPRVIDNDEEYNRLEQIFEKLLGKNRSPEEDTIFDLLANLLEDYENRTLEPIKSLSPNELVKSLMQVNGLKQSDLIPIFGSQSVVSEVINGKRKITLSQAKAFSERFKIKLEALV